MTAILYKNIFRTLPAVNGCYNSLKETLTYDRLRASYNDFLTIGVCVYTPTPSKRSCERAEGGLRAF